MSLTRATRPRQALLRDLATQAASHPRMEAAILGAIRGELPGVIEELLRDLYRGETVRLYVPKRGGAADREHRDRRIEAALAAHEAPAAVAAREGVSRRRVEQIGARARARAAKSSA